MAYFGKNNIITLGDYSDAFGPVIFTSPQKSLIRFIVFFQTVISLTDPDFRHSTSVNPLLDHSIVSLLSEEAA